MDDALFSDCTKLGHSHAWDAQDGTITGACRKRLARINMIYKNLRDRVAIVKGIGGDLW